MGIFLLWGPFEKLVSVAGTKPSWLLDVSSFETAKTELEKTSEPALMFVTEEILRQNAPDLIRLRDLYVNLDIVYVSYSDDTKTNMQWLKTVSSINHLLPSHSKITQSLFQRILVEDWSRVFAQDPQKIFYPDNIVGLQEMELFEVDECEAAYKRLDEFLSQRPCFPGFKEMMATAASELLTNAFFNARRDQSGKAVVADRKLKFALEKHQSVKFMFGQSGDYFWMCVSDSFGSLDRATLINAMNRAATERTAKLNTAGGAGLGLMMLYEWASELGFHLTLGTSTKVACRFKMSRRQKEFDSEPSILHVFSS